MTPVKAINHIGIAVRSIDTQRAFYEATLGAEFEGVEEVPDQGVRVGFFRVGDVRLELLEPTAPDSPIAKFLADRGEGLHHLALRTDDITGQLAQAAAAGVRLINEKPVEGAAGKLVAFLHPKSTHGVLTELCAAKPA